MPSDRAMPLPGAWADLPSHLLRETVWTPALPCPRSLFLNWLLLPSYLVQLVAIILLGLLLLDKNFYSNCICFQWKFFRVTSEEKMYFYILKSKYQTVVRVYLLWTRQRSSLFTLSAQEEKKKYNQNEMNVHEFSNKNRTSATHSIRLRIILVNKLASLWKGRDWQVEEWRSKSSNACLLSFVNQAEDKISSHLQGCKAVLQ